eukprot:m.105967 g.105967  ORF g.105967 m.105967 type:complete len:417 (+) comp51668_c0_seq2:105-1355(+)
MWRRLAAGGVCVVLLVLLLLRLQNGYHTAAVDFRVGTYNIWNEMFAYNTRYLAIAESIQRHQLDVVALQEVRFQRHGSVWRPLLPALPYHWSVYATAAHVRTDVREGIALLSRFPVLNSSTIELTSSPNDPDLNQRVAIGAWIAVPAVGSVLVVTSHFSYDRRLQCRNLDDILTFIAAQKELVSKEAPVIFLGDLNIYADDDAVLDRLTAPDSPQNRCPQHGRTPLLGPFVDAGSRSSSGNTFSNMPTPGSVARPDRLLYTETPLWTAVSSQVVADDPEAYRQRFWMHLFAERLLLVLANEACLFDCGPRGKCVCGVCILAAEENCPPPCPICENFAQKITLTVAGYLVGLLLLMRLCRHCHKWMRLVACVVFLMTAPLSLRIVAPTETGIIASRIMPEEFFASDHRLLLASFLTS